MTASTEQTEAMEKNIEEVQTEWTGVITSPSQQPNQGTTGFNKIVTLFALVVRRRILRLPWYILTLGHFQSLAFTYGMQLAVTG
jgi:hypothetical protein